MEHTVRKSKANRIAMRITALFFVFVGVLSWYFCLTKERSIGRFLVMMLCVGCISYGMYLLVQTMRIQAYDITYVFGEREMKLRHHRGEEVYSYSDITKVNYVVPNENMDYGVVQLYFGKKQYVIPFMGNRNVGEALYGMLEMKREEMMKME